MTEFNRTEKDITPMGRFPHYGILKEDYLLIQGCCVGPKKCMALDQVWPPSFPDNQGEEPVLRQAQCLVVVCQLSCFQAVMVSLCAERFVIFETVLFTSFLVWFENTLKFISPEGLFATFV
ncbi:hypothetical protein MLD38_032223 [Melastoma candidum]|uniref:Uncharacterized protein n=1 Tax=Melastoma candidum TaxID=119954 RepID=A0ACB9M3L6_9MYRT|nr:hypothetical protein MLD38_032223 [Melastoma candidum]